MENNVEKGLFDGFGSKIKAKRKDKGLTQKDLAEKVGVSHEWICKIEKGNVSAMSTALITKLSDTLGLKTSLVIIDDFNGKITSKNKE